MILEVYKNNPALRNRYFEMNGITHVTATLRTAASRECKYHVFLCNKDLQGFSEYDKAFPSIKAVKAWAKEYTPELEWLTWDYN